MKKKRSHAKLSDGSTAMRSEYVSPTDPRLCFPISMDCPYITTITGLNMYLILINTTLHGFDSSTIISTDFVSCKFLIKSLQNFPVIIK